ncbi:MAG: hypothetical protein MdMp014T_0770 [Treponematales bacterium]
MARMTEEEAWALDEYYTSHTPKLSGDGKSGFFARRAAQGGALVLVDDLTATWLRVKAEAVHKTAAEIIGDLVRKEITAAASA